MTSRGGWKSAERRIARKLGGERTPLSGENSRHTSGDAIDIPEYLEVKMQPENKSHEQLTELGKKARRRDRHPLIIYEHTDYNPTVRWAAMWFDHFLELREAKINSVYRKLRDINFVDEGCSPYLIEHRVGARLTNGALVFDTIGCADDEGKPPLIVIQKKRSSNQLTLIPLSVEVL